MYKKTSLLLLVLIFFFGCTKIENDSAIFNKTAQVDNENLTKFAVSQRSVEQYIQIINAKKPDIVIKEIVPIVKGVDTLLYIVNFTNDKGWKIISGDKRTTPELSSSKSGEFLLKDANPGVAIWLDEICSNIYTLKCSSNCDTTSSYFKLWTNIESIGKFKKINSSALTKGGGEEEEGYWTLIYIESEELTATNEVTPLIQTKWGQRFPWNNCVPIDLDANQICATGCVNVAGAQMAYYLHYKYGFPQNTYAIGNCYGYVANGYPCCVFNFDTLSLDTTSWSLMPYYSPGCTTNGTNKVGILMANIGYTIGTNWGYNSSTASMSDLPIYLSNNGINCSYGDYNITLVKNQLNNGTPVIVRADANRYMGHFLGIPTGYIYTDSHAWIIDGYIDVPTKFTYYYQWFDKNDPLPEVNLLDTEHIRTEESTINSSYLYMNWGYDGDGDFARYLDSQDTWTIFGFNFRYNRKILYNFTPQI